MRSEKIDQHPSKSTENPLEILSEYFISQPLDKLWSSETETSDVCSSLVKDAFCEMKTVICGSELLFVKFERPKRIGGVKPELGECLNPENNVHVT